MCCFSRPVTSVTQTRIFARPLIGGRQVLVYEMQLDAREDLAMILPLPVGKGAKEDALTFVNLDGYPQFFTDLANGFPSAGESKGFAPMERGAAQKLAVLKVGSFVASFVPRIADFERLDPRFRLPTGVWEKIGAYADYGFAVFQLRKGRARIHPMAFTFPNALGSQLFFPTVHIHDGKVHLRAEFDHVLYCQASKMGRAALAEWSASDLPAARFVDVARARKLVVGDRHVYRRFIVGENKNEDVLLAAA